MFNSKGRMYFYSLLKSILLSPFVKMGFVLSFATDQSVSFITSIKDFAYSICFYGSNFTVAEVSNCLKPSSLNGIIVGYIAALIPLVLRLIQCYRTAIQNSGQFFGDLQMWNFFKYVSSILTSTLSFLSSLYPGLFVPFLVSSIVSTSYSYYWDLVCITLCRKLIGACWKKIPNIFYWEISCAINTPSFTMWPSLSIWFLGARGLSPSRQPSCY